MSSSIEQMDQLNFSVARLTSYRAGTFQDNWEPAWESAFEACAILPVGSSPSASKSSVCA